MNWFDTLVYCNKKSLADGLTPCYTISGSKNPNDWGDIPTSSSKPTYATYSAVTCDWDANGWRLPTEAEWEYLARGGNLSSTGQTKYSGSDNINEVCWCSDNITITPRSPQDVRTKAPNSLQLYDMSGNVFEWCWDRSIETVAIDTPMTGPESGNNRVCRGGSYGNTQIQDQLTVYGRSNQAPSLRSVSNGLRVVRSEDTATSYDYEYVFHTEPSNAPALATDSAGASGKYIYFGDWPQTIGAASVTVDETKTMTQGAFTYYKGDDGYWYAKAYERANRADFAYSDGTPAAQGGASFKYFKVEPIKWRVINEDYNSEGNWQLIAERILTANILWYDSRNTRTIGGETIRSYNYKHSRIRAYLNGISYNKDGSDSAEFVDKGFLQTAFDSAAQTAISQVTVANNDYGGADTNDKVFLVGDGEVTSYRKRKVTDFALANNAWKDDTSSGCGYWWTRTPSNLGNIYYYNNVGSSYGDPRYCNGYPEYGVVPCLVIPPLP